MHMVRDQYTKKDQEKFKNIVPKTSFFKDFPSTKKIPKTIQGVQGIQVLLATMQHNFQHYVKKIARLVQKNSFLAKKCVFN